MTILDFHKHTTRQTREPKHIGANLYPMSFRQQIFIKIGKGLQNRKMQSKI